MTAFRFRLAQALRWREQLARVEESRLAAAAVRVGEIRDARVNLQKDVMAAAHDVTNEVPGSILHSYESFMQACRRSDEKLAQQEKRAMEECAAATGRLLEATRRVRLLDKLRVGERRGWQLELDRELAMASDEAFLARYSAGVRSGNRAEVLRSGAGTVQSENGRARSSGG